MTILLEPKKVQVIKSAVKSRTPIMLVGETGVGKTTIVSELAIEQGKSLIRLSLNDQIGREDLIGKYGLKNGTTEWQDGALIEAMRKGHWIVLDELNSARPEVLFALHAILDDERAIILQEKDNERIEAHDEFRLFGTINPITYHGTKSLNQAFMSRFIVISVSVLPKNKEAILIEKKTGIKQETSVALTNLADTLRKIHKAGDIEYFCSTRDLVMAGLLVNEGVPYEVAVATCVFNKMSNDDIEYISATAKIDRFIEESEDQAKKDIKEAKALENKVAKLKKQESELLAHVAKLSFRLKKKLSHKLEKETLDGVLGKIEMLYSATLSEALENANEWGVGAKVRVVHELDYATESDGIPEELIAHGQANIRGQVGEIVATHNEYYLVRVSQSDANNNLYIQLGYKKEALELI